jgi:hypothetical protein
MIKPVSAQAAAVTRPLDVDNSASLQVLSHRRGPIDPSAAHDGYDSVSIEECDSVRSTNPCVCLQPIGKDGA